MKPFHRSLLNALALFFASIFVVSAATSTWTGNVDTFWTTTGNWDAAPASGDDILFPNVTTTRMKMLSYQNSSRAFAFQ